jgi:hypothetical protein
MRSIPDEKLFIESVSSRQLTDPIVGFKSAGEMLAPIRIDRGVVGLPLSHLWMIEKT